MTDTPEEPDGAGHVTADDWAAALAEDTRNAAPAAAQPVGDDVFPEMTPTAPPIPLTAAAAPSGVQLGMERINNIPVQLTAQLGRTRITIKHLLALQQGSVIELDGLAGQPLDVMINGYPLAQGQVVQMGDKYGIRITDIVLPHERIEKLAR